MQSVAEIIIQMFVFFFLLANFEWYDWQFGKQKGKMEKWGRYLFSSGTYFCCLIVELVILKGALSEYAVIRFTVQGLL